MDDQNQVNCRCIALPVASKIDSIQKADTSYAKLISQSQSLHWVTHLKWILQSISLLEGKQKQIQNFNQP